MNKLRNPIHRYIDLNTEAAGNLFATDLYGLTPKFDFCSEWKLIRLHLNIDGRGAGPLPALPALLGIVQRLPTRGVTTWLSRVSCNKTKESFQDLVRPGTRGFEAALSQLLTMMRLWKIRTGGRAFCVENCSWAQVQKRPVVQFKPVW